MAVTLKLHPCTDTDESGAEVVTEKIYVAPRPRARKIREIAELTSKIDLNNLSPDELDELVNYIVELFGNKFTVDEFYDGLYSDEFTPTIQRVINEITTATEQKISEIPNGHGGK